MYRTWCGLLLTGFVGAEQVALVTDALREGVVSLIRDLNGNHVIQRCLQRLGPEDSQFVYDAAAAHTMDIATHRHGCCVLQRCIDFATPPQKRRLVDQISSHALPLSQVCICLLPYILLFHNNHCRLILLAACLLHAKSGFVHAGPLWELRSPIRS